MAKLAELLHERGEVADAMVALADAQTFDKKKFKQLDDKLIDLDDRIAAVNRGRDTARREAKPGGGDSVALEVPGIEALDFHGRMKAIQEHFRKNFNPELHFRSLGEQLQAVARSYSGGTTDNRLVRAPFGQGETDPSGGGFAVQTDFVASILTRSYDMGELLKRVFKLSISSAANGIKIPGVDESSRATGSRWGGVQSYWVAEGDSVSATKPKFRLIELDLHKLMSVWYVTEELLADAAALTGIANEAFAEEVVFMTEDGIFEGSGTGQPQGIMGSTALVTAATQKGQAAGTLLWPNIVQMWSQGWSRSRKNAVWLINQNVEPQLYQMNQAAGTGGVPVYLPAGTFGSQAAGLPYSMLLGRPVIATEYSNSLGTPGDILLADLSQYVLADKTGMNMQTSLHVRFLTDEMTFRLTYRVDGQPIWKAPLTPFKGSSQLAPFVALAQR